MAFGMPDEDQFPSGFLVFPRRFGGEPVAVSMSQNKRTTQVRHPWPADCSC